MRERSEQARMRIKMLVAAALVLLFIGVVWSVPPDRLAWQGPLVMGTLAMPTPNPPKFRQRALRHNSGSLFSLLAFVSDAGIAVLAVPRLLAKPRGPKATKKALHPPVDS